MKQQDIEQIRNLFLDANISHLKCLEPIKDYLESCESYEDIQGAINATDEYIAKASKIIAESA